MSGRPVKKSFPIILFMAVLLFSIGLAQQWVLPAVRIDMPQKAKAPETAPSLPPVEEEMAVDKNAWELVLVNAAHVLDAEYEVELEPVEGYLFDKRAAGALRAMLEAAEADGVRLVIISTYRSFEKSRWNYNEKVRTLMEEGYTRPDAEAEAQRWIALPGMSEHNTGLALDVVSGDYYNVFGRALETDFEGYRGFQWLYEHCADYGFILRYPKDKEEVTGIHYEPWHYRYVGVENARAIMEREITLEEYLGES